MNSKILLRKIVATSGLELRNTKGIETLDEQTAKHIVQVLTANTSQLNKPSLSALIQIGSKKLAAGNEPIF